MADEPTIHSKQNSFFKLLNTWYGALGLLGGAFWAGVGLNDHFVVAPLECQIKVLDGKVDKLEKRDCERIVEDMVKTKARLSILEGDVSAFKSALIKCREELVKADPEVASKMGIVVPSVISPGVMAVQEIQQRAIPKEDPWDKFSRLQKKPPKIFFGSFGARAKTYFATIRLPAEFIPRNFWVPVARAEDNKWVEKKFKIEDKEPLTAGKVYLSIEPLNIMKLNENGTMEDTLKGTVVKGTRLIFLELKKLPNNQVVARVDIVRDVEEE